MPDTLKNNGADKTAEEDSDPNVHRTRAHSMGRVHFVEEQLDAEHSGQFTVDVDDKKSKAEAHVGILTQNHIYEIQVPLPFYLGDKLKHLNPTEHNKLVKVSADNDKSKHVIRVQFVSDRPHEVSHAYRLELDSCQHFDLVIVANVLSVGKGTPLLKSGVRQTGVINAETSDAESLPGS